jgi:hypothetical protein
VILRAYFDDSGSNANEPVYVLGGFMAPVEAWADFSEAWRAVLVGPPHLEYFKMNEAYRLKMQFEGWHAAERDARVVELARVIAKFATHRIISNVSRRQFDAAMVRFHAAKGFTDKEFPLGLDPYFILFYDLATTIAWVRRREGLGEDCEYVFDHHNALGDRTVGYWEMFLENLSDGLRPFAGRKPVHQDDKLALPLQAADLYAWQMRRLILEPNPESVMPSAALMELRNLDVIERTLSPAFLDKTVDQIIRVWDASSSSR